MTEDRAVLIEIVMSKVEVISQLDAATTGFNYNLYLTRMAGYFKVALYTQKGPSLKINLMYILVHCACESNFIFGYEKRFLPQSFKESRQSPFTLQWLSVGYTVLR